MNEKNYPVQFYGTRFFAVLPLLFLMAGTFYFYVILGADSMVVLPMGCFAGLIACSLLSKNIGNFWDAAVRGMSDEGAGIIALILIFAGIYSSMMAKANVAGGFVWIGEMLHLSGPLFCVFTFVAVAIIATSTGTSVGSIITASSIMYPAGVLLGVNHLVLMGAIISGALVGDTIGPVSDVTIAACITQKYKNKHGTADIPGSVFSRLKYSLAISAICIVILLFTSGSGNDLQGYDVEALIAQHSYPKGLLMLLSVVLLLVAAVKTRNTFISITVGIVSGTVIALVAGIFPASAILSVEGADVTGFIAEGIAGILEVVLFTYGLFAMIGVLKESGTMELVIEKLNESKFAGSVIGTECIIMVGTIVSSISMGGDNSPAIMLFGPVANELGQAKNLHPYRRANLLSGFSSTLAFLIPFSSFFIFMSVSCANSASQTYPFIPTISPTELPKTMIFCMVSFAVYLFSIVMGWGRKYEGPQGEPISAPNEAL